MFGCLSECIPPPGTVSGEGLSEAIQLLSCRPTRCVLPQNAPYGGMWAEGHDDRPHKRHPGPLQRGAWQSVDVPHSSGMSVTEHYDIFPPGMPLTSLTSRKSSSSTDSSSCLSIHSRSTTSSSEKGSESISSAGVCRKQSLKNKIKYSHCVRRMQFVCIQIFTRCGAATNTCHSSDCQSHRSRRTIATPRTRPPRRAPPSRGRLNVFEAF